MKAEKETLQLIKGAQLINGKEDLPIEKGAVLIDGKLIAQAGEQHTITLPEGVQVMEHFFPGCTILPGLVDAHTHLSLPGDGRNRE